MYNIIVYIITVYILDILTILINKFDPNVHIDKIFIFNIITTTIYPDKFSHFITPSYFYLPKY